MSIETTYVDYELNGTVYQGFAAWQGDSERARPGVLVSHAWAGRTPFEDERAVRLAELGYTGFALDVYGKGIVGSGPEENGKLMQPMLDDRSELLARLTAARAAMNGLSSVDASRNAIIGYCFGGLCALDVARSGTDIAGAVSIHGLFTPPSDSGPVIKSKVLALHGWDDPMAPPQSVLDLAKEMSARNADWQLHAYGNTLHSFTNPAANDPEAGTVYSARADRRSWSAIKDFLNEIF